MYIFLCLCVKDIPGNCPILNEAPTPTSAGQFWLLATGTSLLGEVKDEVVVVGEQLVAFYSTGLSLVPFAFMGI